jgi:hypothetical protein
VKADLRDAQASVEWGRSQYPTFQGRFRDWEATITYECRAEEPPSMRNLMIVRMEQLPSIFHAELGAIINAFRSALDLLAASLARRNGKTANDRTYFPIFNSQNAFMHSRREIKNWFSISDLKIIKSLAPYNGGNELIWTLHRLDITRKHKRLLKTLAISQPAIFGKNVDFRDVNSLEDGTILFYYPKGTVPEIINPGINVVFDEPDLPVVHNETIFPKLDYIANEVINIISCFDK